MQCGFHSSWDPWNILPVVSLAVISRFGHSTYSDRVRETHCLFRLHKSGDTVSVQASIVLTSSVLSSSAYYVSNLTVGVLPPIKWWAFPRALLTLALLLSKASGTGGNSSNEGPIALCYNQTVVWAQGKEMVGTAALMLHSHTVLSVVLSDKVCNHSAVRPSCCH